MKILTGRFKGRAIAFRPAADLRPTADKTRKAVADTLAGWIEGRRVLDLYSGTGALGMELLSAGASETVFVEKNAALARRIRAWLADAGAASECEVLAEDARRAVERLEKTDERFDLVILDPPYADPQAAEVLAKSGALLKKGGLVVYECRFSMAAPALEGLEKIRDKVYGDARLAVYRKKP